MGCFILDCGVLLRFVGGFLEAYFAMPKGIDGGYFGACTYRTCTHRTCTYTTCTHTTCTYTTCTYTTCTYTTCSKQWNIEVVYLGWKVWPGLSH